MHYCPTNVDLPDWMSTPARSGLLAEACRLSPSYRELDDIVRRLLAVAEKEHRAEKFVEAIRAFGKPPPVSWLDLMEKVSTKIIGAKAKEAWRRRLLFTMLEGQGSITYNPNQK